MKKNCLIKILVSIAMFMLTACGKESGESHLGEGMKLIENADYDGALSEFEEGLSSGENKELLLRGKGLAYIGKTQYADAVSSFLDALHECDGDVTDLEIDINYYLALAYYRSGMLTESYDAYTSITDLEPEEADAYFSRGEVLLAMGSFELAKADFDKAVGLAGDNYSMYILVFQSLDKYGYHDEGISYLENAMNAGSKTMSDYDRGRICFYMGDYENACAYLDEASKISSSEEVTLALGQSYEATGDINFAASIYTNYIANYGASAAIYNQLGLCRMASGDYEAALSAIESGISMNNMDVLQTLKYNEIVCYEYLGDFTKAKVLMESYLSNYPDDAAAQREYDFLKTR